MPTDVPYLEAEANDVVKEVRRASNEFKQYNKDLEKTAKVTKTVTDASNTMTRTLVSMDKAGNKVVVTQKKAIKGWDMQSTVVTKAATNQKKLTAFTINYASALRLVGVQLAHRAIASSVSSIREAAVEYKNIAIAVGEIKTISQDIPLADADWLQGARELSATFGTTTRDQLEATYQALSNQVVKTADDLHFLAAANKFAITAATSNENAVNLLSSALNSYNLDVTQAEKVSAKLFKTIELGRIRASELANTLGSVALISKQTNIEMDELLAFMAALSKTGFKATETMTQLRGIIVKILKPTERMKEFFNELGVASGEEALQIHGLVGFLEKLRESTGGSSTELGKMISRIRGLSAGLFGTTERGLTEISDALDQIRNSSGSFEQAYMGMLKNIGTRTNIQTQKVKLYYESLAQTGVTTFTSVAESVGGADIAIKLLTRSLAFGLVAAAARSVLALNAVTRAALVAKGASGIAAIGGAPTLIAVGAAIAIAAAYTYIEKQAEKAAKAESDYRKKVIFDINKSGEDAKIAYGNSIDAQILVLEKFYVIQRKWRLNDLESLKEYYYEAQDEVKKYYSFTLAEAGATAKEITKQYNQTLSALESVTKQRRDIIRSSDDTITDALIGQREGKNKIGAFKEVLRGLEKRRVAAAKAGNKEQYDYLSKRIRSIFSEQLKFEAKLTENNKKAVETRTELATEKAKIEAEYRRAIELANLEETDLARAKGIAKANMARQKGLLTIAKKEKEIALVKFKATDVIAAELNLRDREIKQLGVLKKELVKLAKTQLKLKIETDISTETLKSGLGTITKFKLNKALTGDTASLKDSLARVKDAYDDVQISQMELGITLTRDADTTSQYQKLVAALKKQLADREVEEQQKKKEVLRKEVKDATGELKDLKTSQNRRLGRAENFAQRNISQALESAKSVNGDVYSTRPAFQVESYLAEKLPSGQSPEERAQAAKEAFNWVSKNVKETKLRLELLTNLQRIQIENKAYLREQSQIQDLMNKKILRELELQKHIAIEKDLHKDIKLDREAAKVNDELKDSRKLAVGLKNTDLQRKKTQDATVLALREKMRIHRAEIALEKSLLEIERKRKALINPTVGINDPTSDPGNYSGTVYGRDNIVTKIAAGESIINSHATKRNFNQLVAINSQPQAAVNGNTTTVGDINVKLNSTGSAKMDARAIALEIKSLVKRGVA